MLPAPGTTVRPDLTEVGADRGHRVDGHPGFAIHRGRGAGAHGASRPGAGNERLPAEILR